MGYPLKPFKTLEKVLNIIRYSHYVNRKFTPEGEGVNFVAFFFSSINKKTRRKLSLFTFFYIYFSYFEECFKALYRLEGEEKGGCLSKYEVY